MAGVGESSADKENHSTFPMKWDAGIPLQIQRPVRAWDRRPLLPLARNKHGVKKIWKRHTTHQTSNTRVRVLGEAISTKTTKRRCVSAERSIETQWEQLASPTKRITTRSLGATDLVVLPSQEEEEDGEDGSSQVDGTLIEVLDDNGRTIEVEEEPSAEWTDEEEVEFDPTLLHLDEAVAHGGPPSSSSRTMNLNDVETTSDPLCLEPAYDPADAALETQLATQLPAGFVSPVRRHRTVSKRLKDINRRRSVPYAFAPEICLPASVNAPRSPLSEENETINEAPDTPSVVTDDDAKQLQQVAPELGSPPRYVEEQVTVSITSPRPLETTPVRSRALRRSPRRKSASPVKARLAIASADTPHYVALSPVPQVVRREQITSSPANIVMESPLAPANEIPVTSTSSPKKKTRLSDDTAFLQAFLNRAAESKSADVSSKEATFNRRESAIIKQAMGSPEKAECITPQDDRLESPPIKQASRSFLVDAQLDMDEDEDEDQDEDELAKDTPAPRIRRSSRERRTIERTVPAVPTRITLHGAKLTPAFKPSEVQRRIMLTRKNTKLNKGDAVPPFMRVWDAQAEESTELPPSKNGIGKTVMWNDEPEIFIFEGPAVAPRWANVETESFVLHDAEDKTPWSPLQKTIGHEDLENTQVQATGESDSQLIAARKESIEVEPVSVQRKLPKPRFNTPRPMVKKRVSRLPAPKASFANALEAAKPTPVSARDEVLSASLAMASPAKRRGSMFSRQLFSGGSIAAAAPPTSQTETLLLASPAKKVRKAVIFGIGQLDGQPEASVRPMPGLASPAKKRVR